MNCRCLKSVFGKVHTSKSQLTQKNLSDTCSTSMSLSQVWISPWQVAHLLSIIETIKVDIPDSLAAVGNDSGSGTSAAAKAGASAMRTQLRIQASLEIPLISAICSV